jgi:hypothetical protein
VTTALQRPSDRPRQWPVAVVEAAWQLHVLRPVHGPVATGRRERMMRVWKRRHQKERLAARAAGIAVEPLATFVRDIGGRIKLLWNGRAIGLRTGVIVRQLILALAQGIGVGPLRFEPDVVVAADVVAVRRAQIDVLEAVERQAHVEIATRLPALGMLLVIGPVGGRRLMRLGEGCIEHHIARSRRRPLEHRRNIREILQMALADQRRGIARGAQCIDEGVGLQRERRAVAAHAVHGRHAARHQGRAIGHADRRRDIEPLEARAARGDRIDVRRLEDRMAVAAEIIDPMLVGDEQQKIRPCHVVDLRDSGRARVSRR